MLGRLESAGITLNESNCVFAQHFLNFIGHRIDEEGLFLYFYFDALTVGSLYANRIFMYFCINVASGPKVKLGSCKSALNTPPPPAVVYSTDRSKAVVPVLVLLFVA